MPQSHLNGGTVASDRSAPLDDPAWLGRFGLQRSGLGVFGCVGCCPPELSGQWGRGPPQRLTL